MLEIRCFRVRRSSGSIIRLEPDPEAPSEPVTLVCDDGVRVGRSAIGDTLLYRDGPYGVNPDQAIRLGWGHLVDPDSTPDEE